MGKTSCENFLFLSEKRTQITGDAEEHHEQHINTPVMVLCPPRQDPAAIPSQEELQSKQVGKKPH